MSHHPFVLDANVFIEAHRRYYSFPICPGFWNSLVHSHQKGLVCSIDRVSQELCASQDLLAQWASSHVPSSFFQPTALTPVLAAYAQINQWVANQPFKKEAVDEFFDGADPWLIAFALTTGATLITHEERAPEAKRRVPIPSVCDQFRVPFINTFQLLSNLGTSFHWIPPLN